MEKYLKKEQIESDSKCSIEKNTFIFILKALKEHGITGADDFIHFWEKQ